MDNTITLAELLQAHLLHTLALYIPRMSHDFIILENIEHIQPPFNIFANEDVVYGAMNIREVNKLIGLDNVLSCIMSCDRNMYLLSKWIFYSSNNCTPQRLLTVTNTDLLL